MLFLASGRDRVIDTAENWPVDLFSVEEMVV